MLPRSPRTGGRQMLGHGGSHRPCCLGRPGYLEVNGASRKSDERHPTMKEA